MLKALASVVRLRIVRLLIECGDHGCCVSGYPKGDRWSEFDLLSSPGDPCSLWVGEPRKEAQWIFYSVNYAVLKELFNFLWQDCCSRSPELVQVEQTVRRCSVSGMPNLFLVSYFDIYRNTERPNERLQHRYQRSG